MIDETVQKVSDQLETMTKDGISTERALDLLEASTNVIEEVLTINIMRECMRELKRIREESQKPLPGRDAEASPEIAEHVA